MDRLLLILLLLFYSINTDAQRGFAFNRISTEDGIGLASNDVHCIYQDKKGFIWVGTANGLQRFDGSKFIHFSANGDPMPHTTVTQIIPADSNRLFLSLGNIHEFGLFDPVSFLYKKIPLQPKKEISPRANYSAWKDASGDIYLSVFKYGVMRYDKKQGAFVDDEHFNLPASWISSVRSFFDDTKKNQTWIATDSGLCIYNKATRQTWSRIFNPGKNPVLQNESIQEGVVKLFIDKKGRTWIINWPKAMHKSQLVCLDSTGTNSNTQDTAGISEGPAGYIEHKDIFETKTGGIWINGGGILYNYDLEQKRFNYIGSDADVTQIGITYETVYQVMDDKDGSIWIATNRGLYFTSAVTGTFSVINILFDNKKNPTEITDILELDNGDYWLTSWSYGVKSLDKYLRKIDNSIYNTPPPKSWTSEQKGNIKLTWALCQQKKDGKVWVGCNGGVLMLHDPKQQTTQYFMPPEFMGSTTRYITEDAMGAVWFGTQGGKIIKYEKEKFSEVQHFNTVVHKLFFDSRGMLWVATYESGLYALDASTGKMLQHFTAGEGPNKLFTNSGSDIEQLNDSIIVLAAGSLNFINKYTGTVRLLTYEEGLPSNSVLRLRTDGNGYLWIITSNGLCRYNPSNNRITSYGRRDGIVLAEKTNMADFQCREGYLIFGGSNAMIMFHPSAFSNTKPPPDVTITDFKIFNQYYPVDSMMMQDKIKLKNDQNSVSIYFASLSFMQRDKLTYYYKMEGLDEDWIKADKSMSVNYSQMPAGNYVFKVYCENLEGIRSPNVTQLHIYIKPPFWRTWWFLSVSLFVIALIIYVVHRLRVNKLLAVEKLRNHVARDLHDDMGSTLSTINILSSMAKSKMNSDSIKAGEYISKITDNSQRMMEAMDDIVWSIKPSNDSMQKIIARMREFATNVLEAKDIELDFSTDESLYDVKLNMQARRDLFLIFKEAVNNAAKYSKASKVEIKILPENKKLVLSVKDNGIGFDVNNADGNGLCNMQKRADNLLGKISIRSYEGEGAEVKLVIPVS
ncbi:MAG: two-component regulator propeller domain-containing protein [Bacteroidota bacterium]